MRLAVGLMTMAVALLMAAGEPVQAADCAPVPGPEGYAATRAVDVRSWDVLKLGLPGGAVTVSGRTCLQHYEADSEDAARAGGAVGAMRAALAADRTDILVAEPRLTIARQRRGDSDIWIRVTSAGVALDVTVVEQVGHRQVLTMPQERDYAPLGHMPDYVAAQPEWRDFDQRVFPLRDGEESVQGRRFEVDYTLREGATPADVRLIQLNYRTALLAAGAEVLFADERNTTARLDRAGQAVWLRVWSEETAINITVIEQSQHRRTLQPPSGRDYPRLGRVAGYLVDTVERKTLDEVIFTVQDGEEVREVKVQGARTEVGYVPRAGGMPASDLDIQLTYRAALADLGGQILFTDAATTVARFADSGALIWVKVWSEETAIAVSIVQERTFKGTVKVIPAETLRAALEGRGRVALFLPFMFDRPGLRADTAPALAEVARMMAEVRGMRLLIENHTDMIGPRARNLALAAARAERVRDALVSAGVDPGRLRAVGIGPDRPAADNATSEGRARNRRTVLIREPAGG